MATRNNDNQMKGQWQVKSHFPRSSHESLDRVSQHYKAEFLDSLPSTGSVSIDIKIKITIKVFCVQEAISNRGRSIILHIYVEREVINYEVVYISTGI